MLCPQCVSKRMGMEMRALVQMTSEAATDQPTDHSCTHKHTQNHKELDVARRAYEKARAIYYTNPTDKNLEVRVMP